MYQFPEILSRKYFSALETYWLMRIRMEDVWLAAEGVSASFSKWCPTRRRHWKSEAVTNRNDSSRVNLYACNDTFF